MLNFNYVLFTVYCSGHKVVSCRLVGFGNLGFNDHRLL